jgi:hypothetical protein
MDRTLLFVVTGKDPEQWTRAELLLCRILLAGPKGSFLFREPDRIGIAARGDSPSWRRPVQLWSTPGITLRHSDRRRPLCLPTLKLDAP